MTSKTVFLALLLSLPAASCGGPKMRNTTMAEFVAHRPEHKLISNKSPKEVVECLAARRAKIYPAGSKNVIRPDKETGAYQYGVYVATDRCTGGGCNPSFRGYEVVYKIVPTNTGSKISAYRIGKVEWSRKAFLKNEVKGCAQLVS